MLQIKSPGIDLIEDLKIISDAIGEEVADEKLLSYTSLGNDYGEGKITAAKLSKDITTLVFDVVLKEELELCLVGEAENSIDFMFCLEGSAKHKFGPKSKFKPINFRQNSIVSRNSSSNSVIRFPADIPLRMSIISYRPSSIQTNNGNIEQLREMGLSILSDMYLRDNYQYLGRVCFKTAKFVEDVIDYSFGTSSDILFKDAAVINTLASQIERHDLDSNGDFSKAPIRQSEIDRIMALEQFICDNLSENITINRLQSISGLNPAKLQTGFKYLFGSSVTSFIIEKRLEKAVELIKTKKDINVSEIVYSIGLSSRSYFTKIFKKHYGILPSKVIANPEILVN